MSVSFPLIEIVFGNLLHNIDTTEPTQKPNLIHIHNVLSREERSGQERFQM